MATSKKARWVEVPMLPMRDLVIFPHTPTPFFIGRPPSTAALERALAEDSRVFVVAQREAMVEDPKREDLFDVGTLGKVLKVIRMPNNTIKALFKAEQRATIVAAEMQGEAYLVRVKPLPELEENSTELIALAKAVRNEFKVYLRELKRNHEGVEPAQLDVRFPSRLAYSIAPVLSLSLEKRQELLEIDDAGKRLELILERMLEECEVKRLEKRLKERVQKQIGRTQKEYYLNEQIKAIQKELGNGEDGKAEAEEYEKRIEQAPLSDEVREVAQKELKKLKLMSSMSAEANVVRNYLDTLLGMPWGEKTEDNFDLRHAEGVLNADHYGLDKVKERIIEYLAVAKRVGRMRGPIICLVGPPGVGKTSLARSVARALGRKFVRFSLGGIRDEADIRGHRRTYVGALPGKIIQSVKKAKSNNPLLLLDEVDKMGAGVMGDPAAALLEVLDPEQNHAFMDHYLEVEYDLSDILFFCTSNYRDGIPPTLRDRMEIISLAGYTELEKENIARQHLIAKQRRENGLQGAQVRFQKTAIQEVIQRYTREAGVRHLERQLGKICRKTATQLVKKPQQKNTVVTVKRVHQLLGVPSFKHDVITSRSEVGVATGMAWTAAGGELLFIEAILMPGRGRLKITGQLGDVMKESVQAALSHVHAHAHRWGIDPQRFRTEDVHIHIPEGAIPKDGPSAGVTLTAAIVSAFSGIPLNQEVAMTGEISLRGRAMQIGGLKEKLLAAMRGGVKTALIPAENEKDLAEIPREIRDSMTIIPLKRVEDYVSRALLHQPQPLVLDEASAQMGLAIPPLPPAPTDLGRPAGGLH